MSYAELHCKSNYSFLEGASHADELVARAAELGYAALAITDRDSLAGVVRAHVAARDAGLKLLVGAELTLRDAPSVVLWAPDRKAYGSLSRLLTLGRRRSPKGECELRFDDLAESGAGLLAGVAAADDTQAAALGRFRDLFGDRGYLLAEVHRGPDDDARLARFAALARQSRLPLVAAGNVHYHASARLPLHDVLTAIRLGTTVAQAGDALLPNAQRHLQPIADRKAAFAAWPQAVARTIEIADRCHFSLAELRYEYPRELSPDGQAPMEYLRQLTWRGAQRRYPAGVPEKVRGLLEHELLLIEKLRYEAYFLTVWDLVRYARSRNILCQGRGSAANSAVCYCLGITAVDPNCLDLLFERFVSEERDEAPDIDVDFEHQRREEVLQYLYDKYGRERAALAATVICYRSRSAVRDVGKALGLSLDRVDALAKLVEGYQYEPKLPERCREVGIDPDSDLGRRLIYLVNELIGFPRHLSQHVGGMVMTQAALCELAPIENAAMADRTIIQWDKSDLDELGILKVDCLALGMLTAIHKCFDLIEQHHGRKLSLASVPQDDPAVYDMICAADTMGVFQIESRAQMSMLPRLAPRCYYDLVIEVAIVRPGPIQGQMVHPYLRRRMGEEQESYPNDAIRDVLHKTLGVPIFQEQAMRLAVVAAGFTPGEADQLRRAMGAWRRQGLIDQFRRKLLAGMRANGLPEEFAQRVFEQIRGFGEYGFPESHAASFALLVYVSAWLKHYYPAAFAASLINSQPMGFYAPAQLVQDARRHGVEVLPADVNHSTWDCTLEPASRHQASSLKSQASPFTPQISLRLGLRMLKGLPEPAAVAIEHARRDGPFQSIDDFTRRTRLCQATVKRLSEADVFGSLQVDRRRALWDSLAQEKQPKSLPLFDALANDEAPAMLPALDAQQNVFADYQTTGLSLRAHPLSFYREQLAQLMVTPAERLCELHNGRPVRVAGLVLLRQRPSTAKGITFVTLEDETGTANLVLHQRTWERFYPIARRSPAWLAHGRLESRDSIIHIVVSRLQDLSQELKTLDTRSRDFR